MVKILVTYSVKFFCYPSTSCLQIAQTCFLGALARQVTSTKYKVSGARFYIEVEDLLLVSAYLDVNDGMNDV